MQLPKARTTELVEQEAGSELLVYDLQTSRAYTLNETSKNVFKACGDGEASFEELKRQHKYTDDIVYLALDELKKNNLVEGNYSSPFSGTSRREAIRRVGLASMVALPLISSLIAPSAANAASGSTVCTPNAAGCTPSGSQYISTQPNSTACFAAPGRIGCCSCARGGASFNGATLQCSNTCA